MHAILDTLKSDVKRFPKLDVSFSSKEPLNTPIIVNLPGNGLRLRFDPTDQRLRLIEIVDLFKDSFLFKNEQLLLLTDEANVKIKSPLMYRRVYQLFGPSYPGEYLGPSHRSRSGTYMLSFPGIAFSFPIDNSAWSPRLDHAKMLSSSGTAVTSIAIFEGASWPEARKDLFTRKPSLPRSLSLPPRHKECMPDEIDFINILEGGHLECLRRSSPPVTILMGDTTAQDLITDLGAPDTIYKRPVRLDDQPQRPARPARRRSSNAITRGSYSSTPSSYSSSNTDTYDVDFEDDDGIDGFDVVRSEEQYYCYFKHGFDILLAPSDPPTTNGHAEPRLTVSRVVLHGNVPGSYAFNRHRRIRWALQYIDHICSESDFNKAHRQLLKKFMGVWPEKDMKDGMVIVRDWNGDSPSGSAILIGDGDEGDEDEDNDGAKNSEQWLKNTQLYKFPGLMFEVMDNGAISALTVY